MTEPNPTETRRTATTPPPQRDRRRAVGRAEVTGRQSVDPDTVNDLIQQLRPLRIPEQQGENPYTGLGKHFLMDRDDLERLTTEDNPNATQVTRDALLLRRIADGELGVPRPSSAVGQDAVRYLLTLIEETPGVAKSNYEIQHTRLQEYLERLIEAERVRAERQSALAKGPTTADGSLPRRVRTQAPETTSSTTATAGPKLEK